MTRRFLPLPAAALLLALACGCGTPSKPGVGSTPPTTGSGTGTASAAAVKPALAEPGAVGTLAPELKGKSWLTADGKAPDLKNKAFVLEFWSVT